MKNLETLINELCPEGVEFKPLWQVTAWDKKFNGVEKKWQQKIISYPYVLAKVFDEIEEPSGNVKLLSTGISDKERWTTEEKAGENLSEGEIVAIPWGGTPNVKYYKGKFVTADNRIATSLDCSILNNKFLYYWLNNNIKKLAKLYRGAGIQHPSMKGVLSLDIPLPPIEVQNEIVRILDKFTELEAELEAELDCRKRQYEYYRDKLLSFENVGGQNVEWKKMSEVGTFIRGNGLQKKDFTEAGVGCIHYGQLYTHYGTSATKTITYCSPELATKLRKASKGDVVIATTSENVEDVCKAVAWLGDNDVAVSGDAFIYKHNQNPKYMAYLFQTLDFFNYKKKKATGTKVIRLSGDAMGNYLAPIPPLAEQERIVSILDRFESLTTSLTAGLPAEIAARRKQYEHYRDKLLTFKRKSA